MNPAADIATIKDVDRAVYVHLKDQIQKDGAPTEYYDVLGHQPDSKALAQLDEQIPLIWIKRKGPPKHSTKVGSTPQHFFEVATEDGEGNPLTYKEIKGGVKCDMTYEVRYICFHEDDERAMTVQLNERFPRHGVALTGPGGNGPFWFELSLATDVPGIRENELGGLYRVIATNVVLGEREISGDVPAITEIDSGPFILIIRFQTVSPYFT